MSVILRLGAVNTETPYSRLVSDGTDYDPPVDMSPVAEELYLSPPQTYPGCFGLPYQDHNYGAPPPPTPPQTPPPPPAVKEPLDIKEEIVVTSDTSVATQLEPQLPDPPEEDVDDPTRCICDFVHDDGYMIQCDKCSVWQHIVCMGLDRDSIPDTYCCELCHPRPVDRARAREFQIRKREFLKNLLINPHDSSTDTDPEEVNNRLKAYGLDPSAQNAKPKQKMKMKKRKERSLSKSSIKKLKTKEIIKEKENTNKDINKRNKLLIKDFSSRTAQVKKEKLTKKIEKMRSERISKEMREDKFSSDDLKEDEKIISTISPNSAPVIQDENAQNPWDLISNSFNEWEQSYEIAKYNQYTTYVQEYLNSTYINGHHNDIADLVTDGLRVQRCHIKDLKNKRKGLQSTCAIPDGQPIIEVIGKVMTRQQYDKDNFGQRQLSPFVFFYGKVFDLDLVIDASDYGNDARFIRRSCQANAVVRHVVAGGQAHFITVATREILEDTEITIPFDYDYKKWNFCVECACLRNNCPVGRYQKKRLRFAKLQIQNPKKFVKSDKNLSPRCEVKSPIRSPTKSPIKTVAKSPEQLPTEDHSPEDTLEETIPVEPATPSPTKMVRRSQVTRQTSNNASTQASSGRLRSLRVPSQPDTTETVADPVTTPEPTNLRSSEVDPLTSPESKENNAQDKQDQPQEKKKLTREERKMEAIMKAFEKMEKRNARRQSVDQAKPKEDKEKKIIKKEPEKQPVVEEEECTPVVEPKEEPKPEVTIQCEPPEPLPPPEPIVEEIPEVKEEEIKVEVKVEEEIPQMIPQMIKPELRQKAVPKGKKAKKTANRRRTRNSSGAAAVSVLEPPVDILEESSNSSTPITSCPSTPVPVVVQVQEESNSASTPFKFLKTKRHLMNEWLIEKSCDIKPIIRPEPLEVAVQEEESMYVTCLPSPRNSMDRLRRNSQSCGSRDKHSQSVESTGSAKKRWLRQAMGEGSSDSGLASPGQAAGGMSPNPQNAMPSPGGSPPTDFVTPLKKRRLARESLSRDSISSESPAQTPTPSATVTATSYFSQMHEACVDKLETYKLKNGLTGFFTPSKTNPEDNIDNSEKSSKVEVCSSEVPNDSPNMADTVDSNKEELQSPDKHENQVLEISGEHSSKQLEEEKDGVSSCAEIDCSVSYNTGTLPVTHREDQQISNTDICSSSDVEEDKEVCDEQSLVCDGKKSANSEPDSSDCAGICSETPMEVECDSGSAELEQVSVEMPVEVDSTESNEPLPMVLDTTDSEQSEVVEASNIEISSQNDQCDSCNSEHLESVTETTEKCSGSSLAEKLCTSSSSHTSASSVTLEVVNSTVDVSDSSKHSIDRISVVDSSTDKNIERVNQETDIVTDSTASVSSRPVPDASGLDSILSVSGLEQVSGSSRSVSGLEQVSGSIRSVSGLEQVSGSIRNVSGTEQVSGSIRNVSGLEQVSGSIRNVSGLEQVTGSIRNVSGLEQVSGSIRNVSGLEQVTGSIRNVSGLEQVSGSIRNVSGLEQVTGSIRNVSGLEQVSGSIRNVSGLEQVTGSIRNVSGQELVSGSSRIVSGLEQVSGSIRRRSVSMSDSETGLINSTIESVPHIGLDSIGATSTNITESLLTSSHLSIETPSVPNRHLRFLTDCQLNTEMVVDSTTQYVPPMLTGSLVNSSGLASVVSYDSDSMDVTSGSDIGLNGGLDENRKSDDSQSGYPDNLSSKGYAEAFTPKEKKKVSLQEYLKRKKDKPSPPVVSSTSGNKAVSSSTVTKSPLRLTTSITLDKLPPLPSLPSLPMFEKTERKEFKSSSDLLSPIFNRKEKQEEVRKPMSLSERLRQEFGLDDSTDTDTDTENKTDQRNGDNEAETDVPPPPPPPPPQGQGLRLSQLKMNQVANGNAIPSLMSLKTFHQPLIKTSETAPVPPVSLPSMAPPGYSSMKPPVGSTPTMIPSPGKSQTNSMPPSLMNLLSNVKSPAQLQNDLTAQLNALKAQISKVQQSLPISSSSSLGNTSTADQMPVSVNGTEANQPKPQVFDYGHQSSANFMRQNSYPSSTTSKNHYHGYNKKSSPSVSHGKSSPGYNKLSSGFSKHSPSAGSQSQASNHSYNSHHSNMSPPGWNQKPTNSHKHLSSTSSANPRKLFTKQTSHKYS